MENNPSTAFAGSSFVPTDGDGGGSLICARICIPPLAITSNCKNQSTNTHCLSSIRVRLKSDPSLPDLPSRRSKAVKQVSCCIGDSQPPPLLEVTRPSDRLCHVVLAGTCPNPIRRVGGFASRRTGFVSTGRLTVAILLRKSELATIRQSGSSFASLGSKLPHRGKSTGALKLASAPVDKRVSACVGLQG